MGFGLPPRFEESRTYTVDRGRLEEAIEATFDALNWSWEVREDGSYLAKVGMTWRSWGERIVVLLEDDITLHIASRSSWPGTVIDWGKNRINVTRFFQELERGLHCHRRN